MRHDRWRDVYAAVAACPASFRDIDYSPRLRNGALKTDMTRRSQIEVKRQVKPRPFDVTGTDVCLSATAAPRRVLDGRRRPRDTRRMGPSSIKATDALSQDAFALYSPSVGCRSVRGDSPLERPRILRELTTTSESSSSSESVLKAILSTSCSVRDMANAKMSCQRERWRREVVVKRRNDSQSHSRPSHPRVARALPSFNAALTTELATFSEKCALSTQRDAKCPANAIICLVCARSRSPAPFNTSHTQGSTSRARSLRRNFGAALMLLRLGVVFVSRRMRKAALICWITTSFYCALRTVISRRFDP